MTEIVDDAGAPELPAGTVTFFFSDIEQSTRLATRLGDAFAAVLERHREIVRGAFAAHGGFEVSTGGDSFFAVFPSAAEAVAAAGEIQRVLERETGIRVRIGLHTGRAVRVGRDYVGLDVHVAARVADAGHGGQVLVSETTRSAVGGPSTDGLHLLDLGRHRLKDVGPQRLWQLGGEDLPAGPFPPLRSLEAHPTNLPLPASPIVDRQRELAELAELCPTTPILTITGPGGIGKTRLAIEVARTLVPRFPDGVFHLDLAALEDSASAAAALVDLLQLAPTPDQPAERTLLDGLRSRDLLLVLETADRVTGIAELVAAIAATCPRIRLIVTSRSPLHVHAERETSVAPLPPQPSVELFLARASAAGARLPDDLATRGSIGRLVSRLDGIPLAIELAAARSRVFSPAVLLDRLERDLPALGAGAVDAPDRQRTLQGTIAWSCDLLPPDEQTLFRELAVFPETFGAEAVESIVTTPSTGDTVAVLEALVDRSLVLADAGGPGEPRFRMLGPIREFARQDLRSTGTEADVQRRFAEHWAAVVRGLQESVDAGAAGAEGLQVMATEEANLRAALAWATATVPASGQPADADRSALALALAGSMGRFWWIRGRVHEGLDWLDRALGANRDARRDGGVARATYWRGVLLDDARRPAEAQSALEVALGIYRELGNDAAIARTLNSLGVVARSIGDTERAEGLFSESIRLKEARGDRAAMAVTLSNFGILATDLGRYDEAVDYLRRALAIDEEFQTGAVPVAIANLGNALIRAGQFDEGLVELRRALPGVKELGDPELVADVLTGAASATLESMEASGPVRAARLLHAALLLRKRAGLPLRAVERAEVDAIDEQIRSRLDPAAAAAAQAEVAGVDVDAAVAMLEDELRVATPG